MPSREGVKNNIESKKDDFISSLKDIPAQFKDKLKSVGFSFNEDERSGSYVQFDHTPILSRSKTGGVEVLSVVDALERYEGLKDYWWKVLPSNLDEYTRLADEELTHGYFIRVKPKTRIILPVQACLFISKPKISQHVHNVIIAEEGSELHIITGCATATHVTSALHVGVSEFYIKKGAKVTFTMIHNWGRDVEVRPRTGVLVEDNSSFISNYVCLGPVKTLQMYPTAYCIGENAKLTFQSVLLASNNSVMDVGSRVYLKARSSKASIISRAVAKGYGEIYARGHLIGESSGVKGHLECRGIILSDTAKIYAIPELEAKVKDVNLTHEAAVGKIAEEEVLYLTARGLTPDEATTVLIGGFLRLNLEDLPQELRFEVSRMMKTLIEKAF
ncbi:MAG: SufD family Fe-S cluster assembly protein [Candidatus Bathyarchaeota archaeon]|nr:SufD family Fe-S cluster assembly protein [Candidatus Bathyarchaeota archaeon]